MLQFFPHNYLFKTFPTRYFQEKVKKIISRKNQGLSGPDDTLLTPLLDIEDANILVDGLSLSIKLKNIIVKTTNQEYSEEDERDIILALFNLFNENNKNYNEEIPEIITELIKVIEEEENFKIDNEEEMLLKIFLEMLT